VKLMPSWSNPPTPFFSS